MTEIINAELVTPLSTADAQRLDKRIRLLVGSIGDSVHKLAELVEEGQRGEIHTALGYPSWTAYVADALRVQVRLDRAQRRELVEYLSGEGISQRVIAAVVGVDQKTVNNNLRAGEENSSPEPNSVAVDPVAAGYVAGDQELADTSAMADVTEQDFEEVLVEARAQGDLSRENVVRLCDKRSEKLVTGLDGKQYPRKRRHSTTARELTPGEQVKRDAKAIAADTTALAARVRKLWSDYAALDPGYCESDDDAFLELIEDAQLHMTNAWGAYLLGGIADD